MTLSTDRKIFERALEKAKMKMLTINHLHNAEPEMLEFLKLVKENPHQEELVIELLKAEMVSKIACGDMIQYFVHCLGWKALEDWAMQNCSSNYNDLRARRYWVNICNAFEPDWEDYEFYNTLRAKRGLPALKAKE